MNRKTGTSGHTGAGLLGHLDHGVEGAIEAQEAVDEARERDAQRKDAERDDRDPR